MQPGSGTDWCDLKFSAELSITLDNGRLKEDTTMATPITGGTAFDFGAAAQVTAPQPTASASQPAKIEPTQDTIKLSDGAQVRLLKTQGQTISEIAISTALSTETVNRYLGITQAPAPTVAPTK
jgi:hypothetical protein